jgi:hypothetical protein
MESVDKYIDEDGIPTSPYKYGDHHADFSAKVRESPYIDYKTHGEKKSLLSKIKGVFTGKKGGDLPNYNTVNLNDDDGSDARRMQYAGYFAVAAIIFIIIIMILYFTGVISTSHSTFVVDTKTSTKLGNNMPNVSGMPINNSPNNWKL